MKFYWTYTLKHHQAGLTQDQVQEMVDKSDDLGAMRQGLLFSIGETSQGIMPLSKNGVVPLTPVEYFKAWAIFTHQLSKMEGMSEGKRAFLTGVHETIKETILAEKGGQP